MSPRAAKTRHPGFPENQVLESWLEMSGYIVMKNPETSAFVRTSCEKAFGAPSLQKLTTRRPALPRPLQLHSGRRPPSWVSRAKDPALRSEMRASGLGRDQSVDSKAEDLAQSSNQHVRNVLLLYVESVSQRV